MICGDNATSLRHIIDCIFELQCPQTLHLYRDGNQKETGTQFLSLVERQLELHQLQEADAQHCVHRIVMAVVMS